MPFKRRVVNTYGRHKFRTVKPDVWAKSPGISSSGNDSSDFDSPALRIRKPLAACTNVPKTQWNVPSSKSKKSVQTNGKENACCVFETSSSSSNDSNSPNFGRTTEIRKDIVQETPPWAVLGHNNIKQTRLKNCSVEITPTRLSSEDKIYFNHNKSSPIIVSDNSHLSSILQGSNLSVKNSLNPETADNSNALSNENSSIVEQADDKSVELMQHKRETPKQPYSTSTPVVRINSQNNQFVTNRGRCRATTLRQASNVSLSDCQVFVEPLKLTPEQYETARLSLSSNKSSDVFVSNNNADTPELTADGQDRKDTSSSTLDEVFDRSVDAIEQTDNKINKKTSPHNEMKVEQTDVIASESDDEDTEDACLSSSSQSTSNHTDQVTECVVALKRLQLSPFKVNGRLDKKRLRARVSLDSSGRLSSQSSLSSINGEDIVCPVTPPRNQSSHISFADVTPQTSLIKGPEDNELSAFEKLLLECEQEKPIKFKEYLKPSLLKKCVKIGEGVYGEVFRTVNQYKQPVALKIIPIDGDFEVNCEPQKSCQEILHEIVISKELSELAYGNEKKSKWSTPNFISVHRVSLIQDKYPAHLIKEWVKWDKKKDSENDKPDIFPPEQLFLVFEFANGGTDLESFEFSSQAEALSVLKQVTLSLAIAEASLEFEHRDLHWGNVLIIDTDEEEIEYTLDGETRVVDSCGVHVSVIDFTLSRLKKDGITVFCNLAEDESLFTGQGDYQFDIYRKMQQINSNEWEAFTPATNIQWLHYLAHKIIAKTFPSRNRADSSALRRFYAKILQFQSTREFVESNNAFF